MLVIPLLVAGGTSASGLFTTEYVTPFMITEVTLKVIVPVLAFCEIVPLSVAVKLPLPTPGTV